MKKLPLLLTFLAGLLWVVMLSAQSANTNYGRNFWFGYTQTVDSTAADYVVYINTFQTTNGTVSVPGMAYSQNFTAVAGITTRIVLPPADVVVTNFTGPVGMAVNIVADSNIAVFGSIEYRERSENAVMNPVSQLGNQYYIMSCNLMSGNYTANSEFMVVAQGCVDTVEIIPSQPITIGGSHPANVPYMVVLNPGEELEVLCDSDLTGTMVMSLNHAETGLIAGSAFDDIECGEAGNPLYEEMLPVNTWGENYVFLPTPQAEDKCRVLSEQNGTIVTFMTNTGNNAITLNAGQYYDTLIEYSNPVFIHSTTPVSVGRYMIGAPCNNYYGRNHHDYGDPAEAIVDANEQMFLDSTVFYVSNTPDFDSLYVQIVTRTADTSTILLDNIHIGGVFITLTPNPLYSYTSLPLRGGSHTITSTGQGFLAYICGLAHIESEATSAGVYLKEINNLSASVLKESGCAASGQATATATGIPPFTYRWSNGQTNQTATGLSAGTYTVNVSDGDCVPHTATASVTITQVPDPIRDSAGISQSISCYGGSASAALGVTGGIGTYTYNWNPGGYTSDTASNLSAGTYTITVTDSSGCSATAALTVTQPASMVILTDSAAAGSPPCIGQASVAVVSGGVPPYTYSWSPGGETTDTIWGQCAGVYCCTVTSANGCSQTTCVTILNTTGIDGIDNDDAGITIYPNPSNGIFTIQSLLISGQWSVEVYNVLGESVFKETLRGTQGDKVINLSSQPNGVYFYRVLGDNGTMVGNGKMAIAQ